MGRIFVGIVPPLGLIESTANSLPDELKQLFFQKVSDLIQSLLPDDLVFARRNPDGIDSEGATASSAGDNCIGVLEIPGLRELCASAVGASDVGST